MSRYPPPGIYASSDSISSIGTNCLGGFLADRNVIELVMAAAGVAVGYFKDRLKIEPMIVNVQVTDQASRMGPQFPCAGKGERERHGRATISRKKLLDFPTRGVSDILRRRLGMHTLQ